MPLPPSTTSGWPLQLTIDAAPFPGLTLFDEPLTLTRRGELSLELTRGSEENSRLTALAKTSQTLSFLPAFSERPFLILPRPRLLCPPGLRLKIELAIPLSVQLFVESKEESHLITEWAPPPYSLGVYGPVDQAQICTSFRSPAAGSPKDFQTLYQDDPVCRLKLSIDAQSAEPTQIPCWARMPLTVINTTSSPLEVNKIMVPTSSLSLAQSRTTGELAINAMTLHLLGPQTAELTEGKPPGKAEGFETLISGKTSAEERRPYVFLHAYKTKTGLEHGF